MIFKYIFANNLWPFFTTLIILLSVSVYSWYRRNVPGALMLAFASLLSAIWVVGSFFEFTAIDAPVKIFWMKFQIIFQLPASTMVFCFILEYAWPGRWLTRRNLILLAIAPLLTVALVLTDNLYHLLWQSLIINGTEIIQQPGPGAWSMVVYDYALSLVKIFVYIWLFSRSPQHRWPVTVMLLGMIGSRLVYILNMLKIFQTTQPFDALLLGYLFLMFAIALFSFRILSPITLARQTVITQMSEGMLVLDSNGQIASLNPAAQAVLGIPEKNALGRSVQDLLPIRSVITTAPSDEVTWQEEIHLGSGIGSRDYLLTISPLRDWRGLSIGRLLLVSDVTELKRTQALLMEQKAIQATLQERERMARELHDTLVQSSASVRMQAETASILLERGEDEQVSQVLNQIADSAQQMHLDLRQYIFDIRTKLSTEHSFFDELQNYLTRFSQTWKIQTELQIPAELEQHGFRKGLVEAQIMGIIQEALINIHKHASAKRVCILFKLNTSCISLIIDDDGCGFNPILPVSYASNHFGMRSMSERAQLLGGLFEIHSTPGQGTQVIVSIPYSETEFPEGKKP